MFHKILPVVTLPVPGEQLEVGHAQVAVVVLMLAPQVLVQLLEGLEAHLVLADRALVGQELGVAVLDLLGLETDLVLAVHRVNVVLDVLELELGEGEDDFGQILHHDSCDNLYDSLVTAYLPADGALVPLTQDAHPR